MVNISYIVPVYNAEKTLVRCVESILYGIGENEEIILVDDGSEDESSVICDRYANANDCVRIFHLINGGESRARNVGIDNSAGEWLIFVDADDFLDADYHELLEGGLEDSLDMLLFAYCQADGGSAQQVERNQAVRRFGREQTEKLVRCCFSGSAEFAGAERFNPRSVWAKVYKREFIQSNGLRFHEDVFIGEDCEFMLECYAKACEVKYIDNIFYHYFFKNMSSITNRYKPNLIENTVCSRRWMEAWLRQFPQYRTDYENYLLNMLILHIRDDFFHPDNHMQVEERRRHVDEVIVLGGYRKSYEAAVRAKKIYLYPFGKRISFWAAAHGKYTMLSLIYKLRYGRLRMTDGER